MTNQFDPRQYASTLEAAGVPSTQAEAHAKALAYVLESPGFFLPGFDRLRSEFNGHVDKINLRLDRLDSRLENAEALHKARSEHIEIVINARIDKLESRLDARIEKLDARIDQLDARIDKLDARIDKLDARFERLEATVHADIAGIRSDAKLHRWMTATLVAFNAAVLVKILFP
ncbi:DUF1640 domain-containing protein [Massilia glaciei]|nr:DUF1640 domain-containing protein [Massilia glaciei]